MKTLSKWQIVLSPPYNLKGSGICTVIINNGTLQLKMQELSAPLV